MKNANLKKRFQPSAPTSPITVSTASCGRKNADRKHYQTVSLDGLAQDTHDNDWAYSDEFLEPAENHTLADHLTPEDFLHAKELLGLIIRHFGFDDAAVALGCKSRRAEAKRLGISLDAYNKRLQRKTASFKQVLIEAGYF